MSPIKLTCVSRGARDRWIKAIRCASLKARRSQQHRKYVGCTSKRISRKDNDKNPPLDWNERFFWGSSIQRRATKANVTPLFFSDPFPEIPSQFLLLGVLSTLLLHTAENATRRASERLPSNAGFLLRVLRRFLRRTAKAKTLTPNPVLLSTLPPDIQLYHSSRGQHISTEAGSDGASFGSWHSMVHQLDDLVRKSLPDFVIPQSIFSGVEMSNFVSRELYRWKACDPLVGPVIGNSHWMHNSTSPVFGDEDDLRGRQERLREAHERNFLMRCAQVDTGFL